MGVRGRPIPPPSRWAAALVAAVAACGPAGEEAEDPEAAGTPAPAAGAAASGSAGLEARALVEHLSPDTIRVREVGPGVRYARLWSARGPWSVHVVEADLSRCEIRLDVLTPEEVGGEGLVPVSELALAGGEDVLVAVNGDFFTPEGTPIGPEVSGGRASWRTSRPALGWSSDRLPDVGRARKSADSIWLDGWSVSVEDPGEGVEVVGGFPQLLERGRPAGDPARAGAPTFSGGRQPRTAVAYDSASARAWLVVVDGRRPGHSVGMTLAELLEALSTLGPVDALNLDGGGSSVMVVEGRVVSRPSDEAGERPVVNALALRRTPGSCPHPGQDLRP